MKYINHNHLNYFIQVDSTETIDVAITRVSEMVRQINDYNWWKIASSPVHWRGNRPIFDVVTTWQLVYNGNISKIRKINSAVPNVVMKVDYTL